MENDSRYLDIILEQTESIVYLSDIETYNLLYVNKKGRAAFGIDENADVANQKCYQILQGKDGPCDFCTNKDLTSSTFCRWKHHNAVTGRYYYMNDKLVELKDGYFVRLEIATDVTDNEKANLVLNQKLTTEETLVRCIHTLSESDNQHNAIEKLLGIISEFYNGRRCYIFEFDLSRDAIINTYEWCTDRTNHVTGHQLVIPMEIVNRWIQTYEQHDTVYLRSDQGSLSPSSDEYQILQLLNVKSLIAAPLLADDQVVGFIGVDEPQINLNASSLLTSVSYFIINDIQKRTMIAQLEDMSYHDILTGLYNRNRYVRDLERYANNIPGCLGVVFMDINGLKLVNDHLGHESGDSLIKKTADIVRRVFGDTVYRIGGDEFIVLYPDISRDTFHKKTEELLAYLAGNEELEISIGSVWEEHPENPNQLVTYADKLMYAEKQRYYSRSPYIGYNHRSTFAKKVLTEIQEQRYEVFLQPQISLNDNQLIGAEALIRKRNPDGTYMLPSAFIPQCEEDGSIYFIDLFVAQSVCELLYRWKQANSVAPMISVNLSRVTLLNTNIVESIKNLCQKYEISPDTLCLEVTESATLYSTNDIKQKITQLSSFGFYLSLDDFGEQCSNLSILIDIAFDEVKLDKSIISRACQNNRAREVIIHTIGVCHELDNTNVVAEGIETTEQKNMLKNMGCNVGQGFLYYRPMPVPEFEKTFHIQSA